LHPILAGRNPEKISSLGSRLDLETRVFDLSDLENTVKNLTGVAAVLHCAGPFSATHKPMYQACLRTKTHYLDITGEIKVFERVQHKRDEILKAGIVVMPGVGFDVVPSDCLAAMLKRDLPDATHLRLAFKLEGKPSPGTLKTLIEGIPAGGVIRRSGQLTLVKSAYGIKKIRFHETEDLAMTIPWGDVSTAFYSTGIPNIEVYIATSRNVVRSFRVLSPIRPVFALPPVQSALKYLVDRYVTGDSESQRTRQKIILWGEALNSEERRVEKRLQTPDGYSFTANSAIRATERVLNGEVKPGPWTPSLAFGPDFVLELDGVSLIKNLR